MTDNVVQMHPHRCQSFVTEFERKIYCTLDQWHDPTEQPHLGFDDHSQYEWEDTYDPLLNEEPWPQS